MVDLNSLSDEQLERIAKGGSTPKKIKSFGEDITELLGQLRRLPEEGVKTVEAIGKHPGQAVAGIAPGITSLADLPSFAYNAANAIPRYLSEKITGREVPEFRNGILPQGETPYIGESVGTSLADIVAGKPKDEAEQLARFGGSIAGSLINPSSLKNIPGVNKVGGLLPSGPKRNALENLKSNLGAELPDAIAKKQAAESIGLNLTPAEATGNPLAAAEQGTRGVTKEGAQKLHEFNKQGLADQKKVIGDLLNDISSNEEIVSDNIRNLSKNIIEGKKFALQEKAAPFYNKAESQLIDNGRFENIIIKDPIVKGSVDKVLKDPLYKAELEGFEPNSIKVLDLAKRNLDDQISTAIRTGSKNEARLLTKSKDRLLEEMDKISPDYKKARNIYSEDLPEIKKLENSAIGKIANLDDQQLKNVSKTVFDPTQTDPKKLALYRDEITKEAPEMWNALVRNDMEARLSKGEISGSSFNKNILQDERLYKQYQLALKNNPEALKKLHIVKGAFSNLIGGKTAKTSAALAKSSLEAPRSSLQYAIQLADKLVGGSYDKAAIDLITGNKWDKQLLALAKKSEPEKIIGLNDILKRATAQAEVIREQKPEAMKSEQDMESLSNEELERIANGG